MNVSEKIMDSEMLLKEIKSLKKTISRHAKPDCGCTNFRKCIIEDCFNPFCHIHDPKQLCKCYPYELCCSECFVKLKKEWNCPICRKQE